PKQHVDIQAAAQMWNDASNSKTANVPRDYDYEDFKDMYMYAYGQGLKGCTTFRMNREGLQGVLVKQQDLKNPTCELTLREGTEEHDLLFQAGKGIRDQSEGRRRDRIRRRSPHRRESLRCDEGRVLRQVLVEGLGAWGSGLGPDKSTRYGLVGRNLFRHLLQPLPREAGGALGRRQATPGRNDHVGRNLLRQQALSPSERAQESKSNARGKRSGDRG